MVRWFTCQTRRIYVDFGEGVVGGGVANGGWVPRSGVPIFTVDSYIA